MKKGLVLLLLLWSNTIVWAQETQSKNEISNVTPVRSERPWGVGFTLLGAGWIASYSVDYFIAPFIAFEAGVGSGFYAGPKYIILGKNHSLSPYVGLMLGKSKHVDYLNPEWNGFYLPVGLQYVATKGFTVEAETAYRTGFESEAWSPIWVGVKLGYHIKLKR